MTIHGEFSREALAERLGPVLLAAIEHEAEHAPPPSPEVVERVRLIFAPGIQQLAKSSGHRPKQPA